MQKFLRGHRVKIDENGCIRRLLDPETEGIIQSSYSDEYGGKGAGSYSLLLQDSNRSGPMAWFSENELELICKDRDAGEKILQEYKKRK